LSSPVFDSDGYDINQASSRETWKQTELYTANGLNGPPVKGSGRFYFFAILRPCRNAHRATRNRRGKRKAVQSSQDGPSSWGDRNVTDWRGAISFSL